MRERPRRMPVSGLAVFSLFIACSVSALSIVEGPFRALLTKNGSRKLISRSPSPLPNIVAIPSRTVMFAESSSDESGREAGDASSKSLDGEDSTAGENPTMRPSTARAGGRSSPSTTSSAPKDADGKFGLAKILIPVFACLLLIKALFGGFGSTNSQYVYYQSSVYQSQSLTPDGRVETSQKTSVRSNVPSLLERQPNGLKDSTFLLRETPDGDFDRDLESVMQLRKSLLEDLRF